MHPIRYTKALRDDSGAVATEYALLVALIAVVIIGTVAMFGGKVSGLFTDTCTSIPPSATSC